MYHGHRADADGDKEPNMTANLVLLSLHTHGYIDNEHEDRSHGCNQTDGRRDQTGRPCGQRSHFPCAIPVSGSICLVYEGVLAGITHHRVKRFVDAVWL